MASNPAASPGKYWGQQHVGPIPGIALIHPYLPSGAAKNRERLRESLALGYLLGALRSHGFDALAVNAEREELGPAEVVARVARHGAPRLVGISVNSQRAYAAAREVASGLKTNDSSTFIVLGGVFASAAASEILLECAAIDAVAMGEGEGIIVDLAHGLVSGAAPETVAGLTVRGADGPFATAARPRLDDLDLLPPPARPDLDGADEASLQGASAYVVSSRGCYAACSFCSIHQIYGNRLVRRRSPQNVVAEITDLVRRYGITRMSFVDDLFVEPSRRGERWVHEFCDLMIEAGAPVQFYAEMRADSVTEGLVGHMRQAGLSRVFIGLEAGAPGVLERFNKGTTVADNEAALATLRSFFEPNAIEFGYIMFEPDLTIDELQQQFDYVVGTGLCKTTHLQNRMNVYWGTPEFDRLRTAGRLAAAPLSERWNYEFTDPRVHQVERQFRLFQKAYDAGSGARVSAVRRRLTRTQHRLEDGAEVERSDLVRQVIKRLNHAERALWIAQFRQALAAATGADFAASEDLEGRLLTDCSWQEALAAQLEAGLGRWSSGGGSIALALPGWTIRVKPSFVGFDRYDNSVEVLRSTDAA